MNKKYIIISTIIFIDLSIIRILNDLGKSAESFIGNVVGVFISLFPILLLLNTLSRDEIINEKVRIVCKWLFYFIVICYFLGIVAEIIES